MREGDRILAACLVLCCTASTQPTSAQEVLRPNAAATRLTAKQRERLARLQLLSNVVLDWCAKVGELSDPQRDQLGPKLRQFNVEFAKSRMRDDGYELARFVGAAEGAGRVLLENQYWKVPPSPWEKLVRATLKAEDFERIEAALVVRRAAQLKHSVGAWVGQIEYVLDGMAPEPREQLREHLTQVYGAQALRWPVCRRNVRLFHLSSDRHARSVLDASVEDLRALGAGTARKSVGRVAVSVKSRWSDDDRDKAIADAMDAGQALLTKVHAIEVSLFANRHRLTNVQKRSLDVAAKGVRARHEPVLRKWIREEVAVVEGFLATLPGPTSRQEVRVAVDRLPLRESSIWKKAIGKLDLQDRVVFADKRVLRTGLASQFLVQLDRELWLLTEQRAAIEQWLQSVGGELKPCDTEAEVADTASSLAKRLLASDTRRVLSQNQVKVLEFLAESNR